MEYNPQTVRDDVEDLVSSLLSRDPVLFNSCLNANFASSAQFSGHWLLIRGASNVKHAAWLFNLLDIGRGAEIAPNSVQFDHRTTTATVRSTRFLRPLIFPLFTVAVPVTSIVTFHAEGGEGAIQDTSEVQDAKSLVRFSQTDPPILYATHWEDQWPVGYFIQRLPLIGLLVRFLITPLASWIVVVISNLLFLLFARTTSLQRHIVARSEESAPVQRGFRAGAQGGRWGMRQVRMVTYPPLRAIELAVQTSVSVVSHAVPFSLPRVSVFDPPSGSNRRRQRRRSNNEGIELTGVTSPRAQLSGQQRLPAPKSNAIRSNQFEETEVEPYQLPAMPPQDSKSKVATVEEESNEREINGAETPSLSQNEGGVKTKKASGEPSTPTKTLKKKKSLTKSPGSSEGGKTKVKSMTSDAASMANEETAQGADTVSTPKKKVSSSDGTEKVQSAKKKVSSSDATETPKKTTKTPTKSSTPKKATSSGDKDSDIKKEEVAEAGESGSRAGEVPSSSSSSVGASGADKKKKKKKAKKSTSSSTRSSEAGDASRGAEDVKMESEA